MGSLGQVLATHEMGVLDLNMLCVRGSVELLLKVIVLRFEIAILTKEAQAFFCRWSHMGHLIW